MTKIPQHGDPELLPKPVVEAPDNRHLPFGPSGVKLPDGDPFAGSRAPATDIKGLPWTRYPKEKWTTADQRLVVLTMISAFVKAHPEFVRWKVFESDQSPRSSTVRGNPILRITFTRRDGSVLETSAAFRFEETQASDLFAAVVVRMRSSLEAMI
jgi:hypothetical protein